MIKKQSDDPNVQDAAKQAALIVNEVLNNLPGAETFDYGGHDLRIGEYDVCVRCTTSIAEAQQAEKALIQKATEIENETIKEHIDLAAKFFNLASQLATVRAEFHNGLGTEEILNALLGHVHDRKIDDDYEHSHHKGQE